MYVFYCILLCIMNDVCITILIDRCTSSLRQLGFVQQHSFDLPSCWFPFCCVLITPDNHSVLMGIRAFSNLWGRDFARISLMGILITLITQN